MGTGSSASPRSTLLLLLLRISVVVASNLRLGARLDEEAHSLYSRFIRRKVQWRRAVRVRRVYVRAVQEQEGDRLGRPPDGSHVQGGLPEAVGPIHLHIDVQVHD
jgi:hypothetical protein